jgi:2-oxoacid:acceptor oxidoreductase gamma subunit (pyruvate/2-ketoisovalerate family)
MMMEKDIIEIRWHGRGGQGAITAAKIVANAAFVSGYGGVVMSPTFGTERRGAPVLTSLKLSKNKIYDLSPIETPDMVVVLDHLLVEEASVTAGLKPGGLIIINSPKKPEDYQLPGVEIAVADVTALASEVGLTKGIVNTGIIGAFARATDLLKLDVLLKAIEEEFQGKKPHENAEAARVTYENTQIGES